MRIHRRRARHGARVSARRSRPPDDMETAPTRAPPPPLPPLLLLLALCCSLAPAAGKVGAGDNGRGRSSHWQVAGELERAPGDRARALCLSRRGPSPGTEPARCGAGGPSPARDAGRAQQCTHGLRDGPAQAWPVANYWENFSRACLRRPAYRALGSA